MSAVPKLNLPTTPTDAPDRKLRLVRPRLNYSAALRAHLHGKCAAGVAIAAGSRCTSRRNLRRVGLKIVKRLKSRYDVLETFDQVGLTMEVFCLKIKELLNATKRQRRFYKGRWFESKPYPHRTIQARACDLFMKATGIPDWPL